MCLVFLSIGATLILPAMDHRYDIFHIFSSGQKELKPLSQNDSKAYDYWYAPPNILGAKIFKSVNWTYWVQWLNQSFYWTSQRSTNKVSWSDASSFLKVHTKYNMTNGTAKISIVLNTTGADQNYYYRFKLNCNESLRQMANHSSLYQYDLTLPANFTENYTISYNFSDLKPLLQSGAITISHNISNDTFSAIVSTVTKIQPNKLFMIDPTFGSTATTAGANGASRYYNYGGRFNCTSAGTADSITAYINYGWAGTMPVQFGLYTVAGVRITNGFTPWTNVSCDGSNHALTINFAGTKPILAVQEYLIIGLLGSNDGGQHFYYDAGTGTEVSTYVAHGPALDASFTPGFETGRIAEIYCSYTAGGGSKSWYQTASWTGTLYNQTPIWNIASTSTGTIYNSSSWQSITWTGNIYNASTWKPITWTGNIYNASSWQPITWTGTIYNASSWQSTTWTGTIYNSSANKTWNNGINTWSGTIYNSSWKMTSSFSGTIYNESGPTAPNITLSSPIPNGGLIIKIDKNNISKTFFNISITRVYNLGKNFNTTFYFNHTFLFTNTSWHNGTITFNLLNYYKKQIKANTNYTWIVNASDKSIYSNQTFNCIPIAEGLVIFILISQDRFTLGLIIGISIFFLLGMILWKKKRKGS